MHATVVFVISLACAFTLPLKDESKITVTYHWQKRSIECDHSEGNPDVTQCALRTDIRNTDFGDGCFDEFVPEVRNIRNLCPLMCQGADDSDVLAKVPTNNHKCNQFFNYGVTKFGDDMYVWRSGECLNATIRFDVRCGFPFKPQDFVASSDLLFSLI
ncbi:Uncharacterized protein T05H10.3 [Toxocara canis]|uniref:Uncharacterized protein T05H10.3 n=2 Tax=Toxocara canis TaxID=6265 RepID=A0A0B2W5T8_TOXCA|nr:Uncharacterized protein T05H10.3 [Toxocara canis]